MEPALGSYDLETLLFNDLSVRNFETMGKSVVVAKCVIVVGRGIPQPGAEAGGMTRYPQAEWSVRIRPSVSLLSSAHRNTQHLTLGTQHTAIRHQIIRNNYGLRLSDPDPIRSQVEDRHMLSSRHHIYTSPHVDRGNGTQ